ncbi:MAG: tRNA pseudouridine(55) synthase TruB [Candidatus Omnitrophota bacterium]
MDGVLNINKPAGLTSHDVVDRIRRAAKMKKVGHTGTLDPMATGVLPLCLGKATKIVQFLIAQDKEYAVTMTLGIVTDSQDTTGQIVEEVPVPTLDEAKIQEIFQRYTGESMQTPPMISAKHHKGKRLYQLARQGVEVEREPCKITIYDLTLLNMRLPEIEFRVICSKGTYIRTLCHDLGEALGSGAAMSGLVRVRCGVFHLDGAVDLDGLQSPDDVAKRLVGLNDALGSMPSVSVGSEGKASLHCGRSLTGGSITRRSGDFDSGSLVRVTTRDGSLIGVGKALMNSRQVDDLAGNLNVIQPVKVLL